MKKSEQLEIILPESENEPKPWFVRVWRYHSYQDDFFATKEDAMEWFAIMDNSDGHWVEGVFNPEGKLVYRGPYYDVKED